RSGRTPRRSARPNAATRPARTPRGGRRPAPRILRCLAFVKSWVLGLPNVKPARQGCQGPSPGAPIRKPGGGRTGGVPSPAADRTGGRTGGPARQYVGGGATQTISPGPSARLAIVWGVAALKGALSPSRGTRRTASTPSPTRP